MDCIESTTARLLADTARMKRPDRRVTLLLGAVVALAVAIPALGADPSPSGGPPGQTKPDKAAKPAKADKGPEMTVTVTGVVRQGTDGKGRPSFSLAASGTTWELSAGPAWFLGDQNPLEASVGKSVTITGTRHEGETELAVETVDGKAIRPAGKPAWAGGPLVVGDGHPGWKAWMADGRPGNGHGREGAPGQNKETPASPD